jgi:hypothetical protein
MRLSLAARSVIVALLALTTVSAWRDAHGQASPYRGLWVGSAALRFVNEVPVSLDENNVPIAPVPAVPTPTEDQADIRLIIHVNGAGQAYLLKDVAILNREEVSTNTTLATGQAVESDLALVTDPRLYSSFPPQPAVRIASAVFDFGDSYATFALDDLVNTAAVMAAKFATNSSLQVGTNGERVQAINASSDLIEPVIGNQAGNADVATSFNDFLQLFNSSAVNTIAADPADPIVTTLYTNATAIRDQSFYRDTRPVDMVTGVVAAVQAATTNNRQAVAHNTASAYADTANLYQRFIAGQVFGEMITAATAEAIVLSLQTNATSDSILAAIRTLPESVAALTGALSAKVNQYTDTRSTDAVNAVLASIATAAMGAGIDFSVVDAAARQTLATMVQRYPLPANAPTLDYTEFVQSPEYAAAVALIADAAARGAIEERAVNPLYTYQSLEDAARLAALNAAQAAYALAARAMRTELPMTGSFAPGAGDPRFIVELTQPTDLGAPGLEATVVLPANHPTNPFRHRRHPDHTTGYDITRHIRMDFDDIGTNSLVMTYGVNKIQGVYREEVLGLHKPLGPDPVNQPIGLKTEGRFTLNRISMIDTLNNF